RSRGRASRQSRTTRRDRFERAKRRGTKPRRHRPHARFNSDASRTVKGKPGTHDMPQPPQVQPHTTRIASIVIARSEPSRAIPLSTTYPAAYPLATTTPQPERRGNLTPRAYSTTKSALPTRANPDTQE